MDQQAPVSPQSASASAPPLRSRAVGLWTAVGRGFAFFIGLFTLLNLFIGLRHTGYDPNLWWIDLHPLPRVAPLVANAVLLYMAILWLIFAFRPVMSDVHRRVLRTSMELVMLFVVWNILNYYAGLGRGFYTTVFAVPFSIFVAVSLVLIWLAAGSDRAATGPRAWLVIVVTVAACAVIFPLLQMVCFGFTDYRRPADAIVVFGARVYADGEPSKAVADRVRTAANLYTNERRLHRPLPKVILSGGPADGGVINETDTMRHLAISYGVDPEDIFLDPRGVNTDATVHNVEPILARVAAERPEHPLSVIAVSHFYHLPRIKMRFKLEDRDAFTVPVREQLAGTPQFMVREVAALWKYYFDALVRI